MRKTILTGFIIGILSLIAIVPVAIGAPGDLVWTEASNPSVSWDEAYAVAVDGTGAYIVGVDNYAGNPRWRIEKRSLTTGSSIWNQASNPSTSWDEAYGVAVDGSGVYIVGHDASLGNNRWRIEKRSLTTGSIIWTQASNPSSAMDEALGVAVDATGVYIVGYDNYLGIPRWRMEKRSLTTGTSIWTPASNPSPTWDEPLGVATDGSGLYIVGFDEYPGTNSRWRIEKRNLTTGNNLWPKTSNPSAFYDEAYGVAVDGSGVYIVGYDSYSGGRRWRIEKREP